jgi:RHS repeat-associated protein
MGGLDVRTILDTCSRTVHRRRSAAPGRPVRVSGAGASSGGTTESRQAARGLAGWVLLCVLGVALVLWFATPASAESLCTDTWTGPSEGEWATAANWSAAHAPTSLDVACVGSGHTAIVNSGSNLVSVVQGAGAIKLTAGILEVLSSLEPSVIASLTQTGGTLTGPASVQASVSLSWTAGTMSGSGQTVVESGASGSLTTESNKFLAGRALVNEGALTYAQGQIWESSGAKLQNAGTFNFNSEWPIQAGSGAEPSLVNTGTLQKTTGTGVSSVGNGILAESTGVVDAATGSLEFGHLAFVSGSVEGSLRVEGATTAGTVNGRNATLTVPLGASLNVNSGSTAMFGTLTLVGAVTGAGTLAISRALTWNAGEMGGSGTTVLQAGATGTFKDVSSFFLRESRTFVNEGAITFSEGQLWMYGTSRLTNEGTFKANAEGLAIRLPEASNPVITNTGIFEKTTAGTTEIDPEVRNEGLIFWETGTLIFARLVEVGNGGWGCNEGSQAFPKHELAAEGDLCLGTGDMTLSQTDVTVGGRGVGLSAARVYNSQAARLLATGSFGYGWTSPYSEHVVPEPEEHRAILVEENGSSVVFAEGEGGAYTAPKGSPLVLHGTPATGYTLTLEDQTVYSFAGSSGRLETITDRNGNATSLTYNGSGQLEKVVDPAGRTLKFGPYNAEGLVEVVTDPMGHEVKYTYESGNLTSVTQPAETALRWQFKYNSEHELTEMSDGRSGKTKYEYASGKLSAKTDPLGRKTTYEYFSGHTSIKNEATKAVTLQYFTSRGEPAKIVHGYGTSSSTTESFTYNVNGDQLTATDGNGHSTTYGYDEHENRTGAKDALGHETKWTYNSTHDVETETKPNGETTTYKRDSHGNPEVVERPAPGGTIQSTSYKYDSHGNIESITDPLKRVSKYEYDNAGDRTVEIDPEGDKRTWGFNEDSQETSTVSPRGHVEGVEEAKYMTTTERDAQGRPLKVIDPLGHETKTKYDGDGNPEVKTDPEGHETTYTYDADNELTKVKEPNGTVTETGYDGAGQVVSQTDGNKHTTKYERNVIEQISEVIDPLGRKTRKEYDAAGNLTIFTDFLKRTTTNKYDSANQLLEVTYSDGTTHAVTYEYNSNGDRTKMTDGTGVTTYQYDALDRLTETKDGHGNTAGYEYDLANEVAKITYPNTKAVTHTYDSAGRLKTVTDWLGHATKLAYDANSNLTATTFPSGTTNEDVYSYDTTDAMKEVKMSKGAETLASLAYTRNRDGAVEAVTSKGFPGEEKPAYTYDANSRLTKGGGVGYKYDEANRPTEVAGLTYSYDAGDELEKAKEGTATKATYSYDEVGERTKVTPSSGQATTYGYDQANRLTTVTRPKEGKIGAIEDSYAYNGDGLRTSQTISGGTNYLAWNLAETLPLMLSDGASSYIYGPGGLPSEQVGSEGTVLYLHHDQQGSTRLLTNATGANVGTATYDAYGNTVGTTGTAKTTLGYDAQYTSPDTGLIYLRSREYDPATVSFVTVDPIDEVTQAPYVYAGDDPLSRGDVTGLCASASEASYRRGASKHECEALLGKLGAKAKELHTRFNQLFHNRNRLGEREIRQYAKTFNDKQSALRKELSRFGALGCDKKSYGLQVPEEVHEALAIKLRLEVRARVY